MALVTTTPCSTTTTEETTTTTITTEMTTLIPVQLVPIIEEPKPIQHLQVSKFKTTLQTIIFSFLVLIFRSLKLEEEVVQKRRICHFRTFSTFMVAQMTKKIQ